MNQQKSLGANKLKSFTIARIVIALVIVGLGIGAMMFGEEIIQISRLRAQIAQIRDFDSAVATFHDKFGGLPGDLLYVTAEREGLPAGDGKPSHSDGDGKISPCNPGWQHHFGCETALFWSQLSLVGLISGDFNADRRFSDERLDSVTVTMAPYMPVSPIGEGIYVAVWNSDGEQPSQAPQLAYGNYYEISRIKGIYNEQIKDSPAALTPTEAYAIDNKIDDASPIYGRIVVNGNAVWPDDAWGTLAKAGENNCVSPERIYNTHNLIIAHKPLCHLAIALDCCESKHDK